MRILRLSVILKSICFSNSSGISEKAQESSNEEKLRINFAVIFDLILRSWSQLMKDMQPA
jgi:hypothetical protein